MLAFCQIADFSQHCETQFYHALFFHFQVENRFHLLRNAFIYFKNHFPELFGIPCPILGVLLYELFFGFLILEFIVRMWDQTVVLKVKIIVSRQ